jgi:hypothetical protein
MKQDQYEYVAVFVDDLAMAMLDPTEFTNALEVKYKFKLKEGYRTNQLSFGHGFQS